MTEADIPWLTYLGKKRYSGRYSEDETVKWFVNICLKQTVLFQPERTDNAFCITMLSIVPWLPLECEANVLFICADDDAYWEGLRLLRSSIAWAKVRKATRWRIVSETDYDLGPLARRVGAKELTSRFSLEL